ncbi:hypothetical protein FDI24_gp006 [Acidovorax phage ACP17]|uniref:Uncharacterized protein n=1 Tax=Acidovorax phage ACP17 TaxID=2010329 RepID=A0A218M3B0_9CAUD|nr:hypothetical protein FDI24_gp006 [Acidovorax phage ACP17]ASD50540.1 hypothetical protein [Acidovorax phage ACP17]
MFPIHLPQNEAWRNRGLHDRHPGRVGRNAPGFRVANQDMTVYKALARDHRADWERTKEAGLTHSNVIPQYVAELVIPEGTAFYAHGYPGAIPLQWMKPWRAYLPGWQKCRAEQAVVKKIEIFYVDAREAYSRDLQGLHKYLKEESVDIPWGQTSVGFSEHDPSFVYKVGDTVAPEFEFSYEPDYCASGIHFFFSKAHALLWGLV